VSDRLPLVRRRLDDNEQVWLLALDVLQAGLDARNRVEAMFDARAVLAEFDDVTVRRVCYVMASLCRLGDRQALRGALFRERFQQSLRRRAG
jgi:hypothetical protein